MAGLTHGQQLGAASAVLLGVALPVSTAAANGLIALTVLSVVAGWGVNATQWRKWATFRQAQDTAMMAAPPRMGLVLLATLALGMLHGNPDAPSAWHGLLDYRALAYFPLFVLAFPNAATRRAGIQAFIAAMAISMLLSTLSAWTPLTFGHATPTEPSPFKNHITHSLLMAFTAYLCALEFQYAEPGTRAFARRVYYRALLAALAVLAVFNVIFITQSRSGYLMLLALALLWGWQRYGGRGLLAAALGLVVVAGSAYALSDRLATRMHATWNHARHYQARVPGVIGEHQETSLSLRIDFARNASELLAQRPWFGHGTGSFAHEYQKLAHTKGITATTNPHNEYLRLGVEVGGLGIVLFGALLVAVWRSANRLPGVYKPMAQGLAVFMASGCLFNSLLSDFTEGHWFVWLGGLLFSAHQFVHKESSQ